MANTGANILVAGAGVTGAVTASILKQTLPSGCRITIWDKAEEAGGRMRTSHSPIDNSCTVDLGAQYIAATPINYDGHKEFYKELESAQILCPLTGAIEEDCFSFPTGTQRFIMPQGSGSLVKHFIDKSGATTKFEHQIKSIQNQEGKLQILTESGVCEAFDIVVLTMPVPQIIQLGGDINSAIDSQPDVKDRLGRVEYSGRFAMGLFYDKGTRIDLPWVTKYFVTDPIIWAVAIDNHKRGVSDVGPSVVILTSVPFGLTHVDEDKDAVCSQHVLPRLQQILPQLPKPVAVKSQQWKYAQVSQAYDDSPGAVVIQKDPFIVCAGDSFTRSGFDGCLDSAIQAAERVVTAYKTRNP